MTAASAAAAPLYSILYRAAGDPDEREPRDAPDFFHDLNLDQLVEWVTASSKDHDIAPYFHAPLADVDAVVYRQEVMRDLDGQPLAKVVRGFADAMREVRQHLSAAEKLYYPLERRRWFVAAVQTWCAAVERLRDAPAPLKIESRGMRALRGPRSGAHARPPRRCAGPVAQRGTGPARAALARRLRCRTRRRRADRRRSGASRGRGGRPGGKRLNAGVAAPRRSPSARQSTSQSWWASTISR